MKFKPNVMKKRLSWEGNNDLYICDHIDCPKIGKYKAPVSRSKLNQYYFFCLNHVKEYNNSWDFYRGLNVEDIELSIRKDIVWDRPSWPLSGNPTKILEQIDDFLNTDYSLFEKERDINIFLKNKLIDHNLTAEEQRKLTILGLKLPLTVKEIKKKYKKLVKIFHPDVNKNNIQAERKFKEINEAYKVLLKRFLIKK